MIFTSGAFLLFYLMVFCIYWSLRERRSQNWFLLFASQVFYGWWDWRFLALMWICIFTCHVATWMIDSGRHPKAAMVGSIVVLLSILGVFKYYNFFADSLVQLAELVGVHLSRTTVSIILPVGISFFTFEAICYVVDVWRREIRADTDLMHTALYISFFPKMMAGPIIRASDFLPQLQQARVFTSRDFLVGMKLFLIGFIYKAVFSDSISPFVDQVYGALNGYDNRSLVMATVGFYAQIYFDFCGYSLMAIGVARTLGFKLPRNFNFPYIATSVTDFWRRWHISLSTWLRDYLYISLGGNRGGKRKRQRNLMTTMLLGGLWHGASWNFVAWGGLHGVALTAHKAFAEVTSGIRKPLFMVALWTVCSWLLTQAFVLLTWIPFRAQNFSGTIDVLRAFAGIDDGGMRAKIPYLAILLPLAVDTFVVGMVISRLRLNDRVPAMGPLATALALGCITAVALASMPLLVKSFIYFQF